MKTKWQGLWKQKEALYISETIRREDIPENAKLIVRYNKYYQKDSSKPNFVYRFVEDEVPVTKGTNSNKKEINPEKLTVEIEKMKKQINNMYTKEDVERIVNSVLQEIFDKPIE